MALTLGFTAMPCLIKLQLQLVYRFTYTSFYGALREKIKIDILTAIMRMESVSAVAMCKPTISDCVNSGVVSSSAWNFSLRNLKAADVPTDGRESRIQRLTEQNF